MKLENRKKCIELVEQLQNWEHMKNEFKSDPLSVISFQLYGSKLFQGEIKTLALKEELEKLRNVIIYKIENKIKEIETELISL